MQASSRKQRSTPVKPAAVLGALVSQSSRAKAAGSVERGAMNAEAIRTKLRSRMKRRTVVRVLTYLIREGLVDGFCSGPGTFAFLATSTGPAAAKKAKALPIRCPPLPTSYDPVCVKDVLFRLIANAETDLAERITCLPGTKLGLSRLYAPRFGVIWDMVTDYAKLVFPGIFVRGLMPVRPTCRLDPDEFGGVAPHTPERLGESYIQAIRDWVNTETRNGCTGLVSESVLALLEDGRIEVRDWLPFSDRLPPRPSGPVFRLPPSASATAAAPSTHQPEQQDCGSGRPPKRGRPHGTKQSDAEEDRRLAEAWKHGQYRSFKDGALKIGIGENELRQAVDRHRKRRK